MFYMIMVLLDTNFLIDIAKFKVDLKEIERMTDKKVELFVTPQVIFELKRRKSDKNAKAAIKFIEIFGIRTIKSIGMNADESIISLAGKDAIVATNDQELRKRLKRMNVKTIYLRGKKHLAMS